MTPPRVVLFDLGNVLAQLRLERFWDVLPEPDADRRDRVGRELWDMGRGYEAGNMTTEAFRRAAGRILEGAAIEDIERAFLGILPGPVEGMEDLVSRVSRTAATALVSNTNPLHVAHCLRTVPALRHLRRFYLSYELRALKPDAAFYQGVIRGEGVAPSDMVFIDDVIDNVRGAESAGMRGILFTSAAQLSEALGAIGFEDL